jgi:hypothetical protein
VGEDFMKEEDENEIVIENLKVIVDYMTAVQKELINDLCELVRVNERLRIEVGILKEKRGYDEGSKRD